MAIELRLPKIQGNDREQLAQIRSYLYQLTEQLQWALNNVSTATSSQEKVVRQEAQVMMPSFQTYFDADIAFAELKSLIIKSADIVEAYYDEINTRLEGMYVAQSDFGDFIEKTEQDIKATSTYVEQKFNDVQVIISDEVAGLNSSFNSAMDTKIGVVNEQIDEVNAAIENTDAEIGNVNTRIDETNGLIESTNDRIDDTNTKILAVEVAIATTNSRIDGVNESIASTNEEIQGMNDLISETNGKIDGLTETIEATNDNIDILIEAKNLNAEDVEKLNTEISKINGSIDEINNTVETIDTEVKSIDGYVNEVGGQVEGINTSVSQLTDLANVLNDSVNHTGNVLEETNAKVDEATGDVQNLKAAVEETTEKVEDLNSAIADANTDIESLKASILETNAYIRSGLLYYGDNSFPVYGLEIGQRNIVNGAEVFNKYARFTSDRLSFYDQNDTEVAYISDYKLYIRNVEITDSFKIGGFVDTTASNGDVVTKWVGGNG